MGSESTRGTKRTVYYALFANLLIAVAKAVGGVFSGSSAMLAEAAHSLADTTNQVFLRISLSHSERGSDEQHPFGYGQTGDPAYCVEHSPQIRRGFDLIG